MANKNTLNTKAEEFQVQSFFYVVGLIFCQGLDQPQLQLVSAELILESYYTPYPILPTRTNKLDQVNQEICRYFL